MASFTETATLKVVDKSSAEIKAINAALKALAKTVAGLKGSKTLGINAPAIKAGAKSINQTIKAVNELRRNEKRAAAEQARNIQANIRRQKQLSATQQEVVRAGYQRESARRIRREAARDAYDAAYDPTRRRARVRTRPPLPPPPSPPGGGGRGAVGGGRGGPAAAGPGRLQAVAYQAHAVAGSFARVVSAASRLASAFGLVGGLASVTREGVNAVVASEDARMRLRQSGFTEKQVDLFMAQARKTQDEFGRVPAAAIANAAVEQLNAIKANNGTQEDYQTALARIAANAQTMSIAYKDPAKGAEAARQLERASQIMGKDVKDADIREVQNAIMRAVIASGGEISGAESVRALQQMGSTIVKSMSAQALTDLLMIRDEGGRQSTAEWRMAIQELSRGSLNADDKAAMARAGLRKKGGAADPAIINEAATDLVGFTERRIVPLLEKAGKAGASSAEIGAYLDEQLGFTQSAARAYADIVTSLRDGELKRQRAAARAVELDPKLGDQTFRGGFERLRATFDTALARPLDKMGPAFSEAITPFTASMSRAGKIAEKGDYTGAAKEMSKAAFDLMGGPVGIAATTLATADAVRTMIDPSASPMDKSASKLMLGATALTTAASAIARYFGQETKEEKAKTLEEQAKEIPATIEDLKKKRAEEEKKGGLGLTARLAAHDERIKTKELQLANVQDELRRVQQQIAEEKAKQKAEDEAEMKRLWEESGLGKGAAVLPPGVTSPLSVEALKQLQQLGTGGGLAKVKSITDLLKVLGQPTTIKSREELAKQLGYTGPLGGSAEMNTFLLKFFKKLAETPPPEPKPPTPPAGTGTGMTPDELTPPFTPEGAAAPLKKVTEDLSSTTSNFQTVVNMLPQKGSEAGSNFNSGVNAQSIGSAIGAAFVAVASGVKIGVDVSGIQQAAAKPAKTGTLNSVPA